MERRLHEKSGMPQDLDLMDEEAKDWWAATRLLARPEQVLEQHVLGSNFWDVIFRQISEWSDMVRKCTCRTEQHVYRFNMFMSLHGNVDQTRDVNDSSAYLYEYKSYLSLY